MSIPEPQDESLTFAQIEGLDQRCLSVLDTMGIEKPTPVQATAIPIALTGRDLVATAQTGTGKTLAFTLPSLTRLAQEKKERNRMLVLLPTRELCIQVEQVVKTMGKALRLRTALIYGGVGYNTQREQLKRGSDIIVATPGRLLDHMGQGAVRFNSLEILVFDEADRMLDMGFLPDIRRILGKLPRERQTLMFSATFAPELQRLTNEMMNDPERIEIGQVARPVDQVRQLLIPLRQEEKSQMLVSLLEEEGEMETTIVFLRTKMRTDRLTKLLKGKGFKAAGIHGDMQQSQRKRAIDGFRAGEYKILVATDVAARGLDIEDITHVVNYDIPESADDYVHRIGRTARAEREGDAITFVCPGDVSALESIERTLGKNIPRKEYEGMPRVLSAFKPAGQKRSARRRKKGSLLRRR